MGSPPAPPLFPKPLTPTPDSLQEADLPGALEALPLWVSDPMGKTQGSLQTIPHFPFGALIILILILSSHTVHDSEMDDVSGHILFSPETSHIPLSLGRAMAVTSFSVLFRMSLGRRHQRIFLPVLPDTVATGGCLHLNWC